MIKNKIKKIEDSTFFPIASVIIINTVFFVICNLLFEFKYEQVDDFIIMNLITKSDGMYSIYGIQMHPIICGLIVLLYKTTININWYTIFMLVMQFISITIIGTVFIKKDKKMGILLHIAFIFIIYSKMLVYIQYTTVAMLCITSGIILLMWSIRDIEKAQNLGLIIAILMIVVGCLIRFSTIIIAIPFLVLYFTCKIIKEKKIKVIKIALLLIICIVAVNVSFNIIYNTNPTYREFLKFHDARTYLHDYNWMNYKGNEKAFNSVNWSKNDRDIFYAYCFGDETVYDTENLEKIKENSLQNKNNNIITKSTNSFKDFSQAVKEENTYKYAFFIVSVLVISCNLCIINKKIKEKCENNYDNIKIIFSNLIFILIVSMHCLFIFLNRPMFRVVISIYIVGSAILMYQLLDIYRLNIKTYIKYISIICILSISIWGINKNIFYAQKFKKDNFSVYKDIIEYTSTHKENAYLYTLVMHDRFLAYSVYEKVADNSYGNLRPLGDWDSYTENYYNFKEKYNIENLLESLYKNDNVYLISGNVIWGENYKDYINIIKKYIKEHYNVNVKSNVIKEFSNNIKIYKLYEE